MDHKAAARYIQERIDEVCPFEDESRRRLYFIGFLSSYLASLMMRDSQEFYRFKHKLDQSLDRNYKMKRPL